MIEPQLTRSERITEIMDFIQEMERQGFGELIITFKNHQIVKTYRGKPSHYGNTSDEWYQK